jgi:hypothetical protein
MPPPARDPASALLQDSVRDAISAIRRTLPFAVLQAIAWVFVYRGLVEAWKLFTGYVVASHGPAVLAVASFGAILALAPLVARRPVEAWMWLLPAGFVPVTFLASAFLGASALRIPVSWLGLCTTVPLVAGAFGDAHAILCADPASSSSAAERIRLAALRWVHVAPIAVASAAVFGVVVLVPEPARTGLAVAATMTGSFLMSAATLEPEVPRAARAFAALRVALGPMFALALVQHLLTTAWYGYGGPALGVQAHTAASMFPPECLWLALNYVYVALYRRAAATPVPADAPTRADPEQVRENPWS